MKHLEKFAAPQNRQEERLSRCRFFCLPYLKGLPDGLGPRKVLPGKRPGMSALILTPTHPSRARLCGRTAGPGTASGHTLDDFNFYYYVQVTLTRSNTSDSASIGGVELSRAINMSRVLTSRAPVRQYR